ncbi:MAG: polysaccharide deacetylase family protein [Oscillospiraceae bacterium]|nr:polysaccharide deacetylase family protein [Oscillospiraceae bacterium]
MQRKTLNFIIAAAVILGVLGLGMMGWTLYKSQVLALSVADGDTIYLEAGIDPLPEGEAYVWSGFLLLEKRAVAVSRTGEIDPKAPGTYTVTYSAKYKNLTAEKTYTVIVRDTTAPVITLTGGAEVVTLPGVPYEDAGFTAIDAAEGDVTDRVIRVEEDGKVTYTVTDTAGNTAVAERILRYEDTVPPVLTLTGSDKVTVYTGQSYREPGYKAIDNGAIDLTDKVEISGTVNVKKAGTYTLTYTVKDSCGNVASATRTVEVKKVNGNGKFIYLTFDDGPGSYTAGLLDILKKYNVKATFFVVSSSKMDILKRMDAEGHTIGLHSNTHEYSEIYANEEAFFADLQAVSDKVYAQVGYHPTIMRFPGGSSNRVSKNYNLGIMTRLTQAVQAQGYRYFDWNVNSEDAEKATPERILEVTIEGVAKRSESMVLMHDIQKNSMQVIEEFIVWALDNGYTFLPITDNTPDFHHPIKN